MENNSFQSQVLSAIQHILFPNPKNPVASTETQRIIKTLLDASKIENINEISINDPYFSPEQQLIMTTVLSRHLKEIRERILSKLCVSDPEIVDVKWRLEYPKNTDQNQEREVFLIDLALKDNENDRNLCFTASPFQLRHLVENLKVAFESVSSL